MVSPKSLSARTRIAQALHAIDSGSGAIVPPLHTATTFARDEYCDLIGDYLYSRNGSPTITQTEQVLAELDGGADAKLFSSGLAAFTTLFETVPAGSHIVAPQIMYHGAQDWLRHIADKRGIDLTLFDQTVPQALVDAIEADRTAIVWIETPVNPTWDVIDIAAAAEAAHNAGALLAVDATVAPPCTMRALEHGADIVLHSATKYLNGHSDVTAGVLVTRNKDSLWEEIVSLRKLMGNILGPFESWLLLRGLRTLFVRFEQCSRNALKIARHFEHHPKLEKVLYPGLASHPGHAIAKRQMQNGFGGMLSLLVRGGGTAAKQVACSVQVFVRATSLGGVESLIEHRKPIEGPHSRVPEQLLRLSIGIEDADDLIADLENALGGLKITPAKQGSGQSDISVNRDKNVAER